MLTHLDALDQATAAFAHSLAAVTDDRWQDPTPCPDWDLGYLTAHVVGGNRFAALVLDGETSERAIAAIMAEGQLGQDPGRDFADSSEEQRRRFRHPGRLQASVEHPVGTISGSRFLAFRVLDVTLHTWDLSVAIGRVAPISAELVDTVNDIVANEGDRLGFGIVPIGSAGPDAVPLDRLLDATGRSPDGWSGTAGQRV